MGKPNLTRIDEVVAEIAVRDEEMAELQSAFVKRDDSLLVSARELGGFLGYQDPSRFIACVDRAKITAQQTGRSISANFVDGNLFDHPGDVYLTPWAAFAAIMEADVKKRKVAMAKSYFAAIVNDEISSDESRLKERQLFRRNHKELHGSAQKCGVVSGKDHAQFDDAGYRGMYTMGVREVEKCKGVPAGASLIDCAGQTELAANNLRMAMTRDAIEGQLVAGKALDKKQANTIHHRKGQIVRKAVTEGTGNPPEFLPLEDKTLNQLSLEMKREFAAIKSLPEN